MLSSCFYDECEDSFDKKIRSQDHPYPSLSNLHPDIILPLEISGELQEDISNSPSPLEMLLTNHLVNKIDKLTPEEKINNFLNDRFSNDSNILKIKYREGNDEIHTNDFYLVKVNKDIDSKELNNVLTKVIDKTYEYCKNNNIMEVFNQIDFFMSR